MDREFIKKTALSLLFSVVAGALLSLIALAVAALFVKNFTLPQGAVTAINWSVKCLSAFVPAVLFLGGERALLKGVASGALYAVLTLILFAIIGGGFHVDGFFALELVVCGILGALGALLGAKFRKA